MTLLENSYPTHKKILLVDDSPICLRIANKMVQKIGFDTELSTNGEEAVIFLENDHEDFCAVLMDLRMPVLDGIQATKKCRELGIEIPIIILTAEPKENYQAAMAVGANYIIEKPATSQQLEEIFDNLNIKPSIKT